MPDDKWLEIIGAKGWLVFSHDRKFHDDSAACLAIKQHNIGCFYLWGANVETWDKLRCFARNYDKIVAAAVSTPKPFIYYATGNYRLNRVKLP